MCVKDFFTDAICKGETHQSPFQKGLSLQPETPIHLKQKGVKDPLSSEEQIKK